MKQGADFIKLDALVLLRDEVATGELEIDNYNDLHNVVFEQHEYVRNNDELARGILSEYGELKAVQDIVTYFDVNYRCGIDSIEFYDVENICNRLFEATGYIVIFIDLFFKLFHEKDHVMLGHLEVNAENNAMIISALEELIIEEMERLK